ncbi:MAG: hypothetical protein WGN25_03835 [Candidatus Electrothrix sp. GW3-4]|uniref:hypothetical protein n=1 Tax=Candidatus Electrothrix sp. GW3-4 TaxID=3126740 RepID=UPI0030D12A25
MKRGRNLLVIATLSIIFFSRPAISSEFGKETQNLMAQTMATKINNVVQNIFSDQTVFKNMQNNMMSIVSDTVKQNTAARKRARVVETCMECRAMQPIKVVISGQSSVLDAATQKMVNQVMAKKIEETIRVISSDPIVASSVQERMMKERMATNPLQEKMQPFMISRFMLEPTTVNIAQKNYNTAKKQLKNTSCSSGNPRLPNC